jgi:hypothetical protein
MRKREVRFSFESDEDYEEMSDYAAKRGLTISMLARLALFAYRNKHPRVAPKVDRGEGPSNFKAILREPGNYWPSLRDAIFKRDGNRCKRCGGDGGGMLHVHHLVSKKNGGTDAPDNLVTLCPKCHSRSHGPNGVDFIAEPKEV